MPTIAIPPIESRDYVKPNDGEIFGSLLMTKNIDLEKNRGKMRISERAHRVFDDGDDADLEVPVQVLRTDASNTDEFWMLAVADGKSSSDGLMWKNGGTDPETGWGQDAISNSPTDAVDNMVIFGEANSDDKLIVARDTDLTLLNNGVWTAAWWQTTLSQSALLAVPHHLHTFLNLLLVPDGRNLHVVDDSDVVVTNRIQIPEEYEIVWVENDGNTVFIGTEHKVGGMGLVFPWDGVSETYDTPQPIFSNISFAGKTLNGVMHTVNGVGQVLAWNGSAFAEVARFPVANSSFTWSQVASFNRLVHMNGMEVIEGDIHILINATIEGTAKQVLETMPAGIWILNEHGLRHKYGLGNFDGATNNDWGDAMMNASGCLVKTSPQDGRFLAGAEIFKTATTTRNCLYASKVAASANNRGWFVTPLLRGGEVRSLWTRIRLAFTKMDSTSKKFIVKYRTVKDQNFDEANFASLFFTGTWDASSALKFTINDAGGSNISVGDEIEVLGGIGGGGLAHVDTIVNTSANNYTITVDTNLPATTNQGTFIFRVQNWIKLDTVSSTSIQEQMMTLTKRSGWLQLKIEFFGDTNSEVTPELELLLIEFKKTLQ